MRLFTPLACAVLAVTLLAAQRDEGKAARFDVASIKETTASDEMVARRMPCFLPAVQRSGSRIRIDLTQLCGLIRIAYDVGEFQVARLPENQGVGQLNFFELDAVVETATPPDMDEIRRMLRTLLAERFQLQVHRESVDMPVYVLVSAEGGPKLTGCADPKATSAYTPGRIVSCAPPMPMARVAQFLSRETGRFVLDKTGLGAATFELHWQADTAPPLPDSLPSLFTAIREQLGLKLEAQRAPVDSIVVTRAERPSPN